MEAREALSAVQSNLQSDPMNPQLAERERCCRRDFVDLRNQEESFYRQKSRIQWLKGGDKNTKFFHQSVKRRQLSNRILSIKDSSGTIITDLSALPQVFINFFSSLLSPHEALSKPSFEELKRAIRRPLNDEQIRVFNEPVTDDDIKSTLFSLAKGKAPGPDGFPSEFFKSNWEIVGPSVLLAVRDFFHSGRLLKEVDAWSCGFFPGRPC